MSLGELCVLPNFLKYKLFQGELSAEATMNSSLVN